MGLEVQRDKCEVLLPNEEVPGLAQEVTELGMKARKGALPLLGTVVSHDRQAMVNWAKDEITDWAKDLPLLTRKELPAQLALLIARWKMVAKPNALSRSLPPQCTVEPLAEYDDAIIRCLERRFQMTFEGVAREVLQLPIKYGGVGFCPSVEVAPHAYVAGMAASLASQLPVANLGGHEGLDAIKRSPSCQDLLNQLEDYQNTPEWKWDGKKKMTNLDDFLRHFWGSTTRPRNCSPTSWLPFVARGHGWSQPKQPSNNAHVLPAEPTRAVRWSGKPSHW